MLHSIKISGKVSGEDQKTRSSLILLHGFLGMANNWLNFSKKLAEKSPQTDFYLLDLRNHGKSFHHDEISYQLMTGDVVQWISDQVDLVRPIILAGHSMGGKVALTLVKEKPEWIEKLVVLDMGISARSVEEFVPLLDFLSRLPLEDYPNRNAVATKIIQTFSSVSPVFGQFLAKNLRWSKASDRLVWGCHLKGLLNQIDFLGEEIFFDQQVTLPTLFVKGRRSNYLTSEEIEKINSFFLDVKVKSIEAGHWLHYDHPEALLKIMQEFLPS